jgi:hypothetical protein
MVDIALGGKNVFWDMYSAVVVGKAYWLAIEAAVRREFGGGGKAAEETAVRVSISGMKKDEFGVKELRVGVLGTSKSGRFSGNWEGRI